MMKKEKSLHKLNKNLTHNIDLESLIVLCLYVTVNIHTQQLSNYALKYWMNYDMPTELEISFDLYDIFVVGRGFLHDFHYGDFQLKLMIQLLANLIKSRRYFQYFEGVLLLVFVVHDL